MDTDSGLPQRIADEVADRLAGAEPAGVKALGGGIATRAYEIAAASGQWVIRVSNDYPEPWRWRGGRRYEVPLLRELAARGLPVPRDPFAIEAEPGYPVAIVERKVAGRPLAFAHGTPAPDGAGIARQVTRFLTVLHEYPTSWAREIGVPTVHHGSESRELLADAAPYLPARVHRLLDRQIRDIEDADPPEALVHGDIRMEHLYVDSDRSLVGVIDFGDVSISDPAYDLAKLTGELGREFGSSLLRHYGKAGDASFEERIHVYERLELLWQVGRPDVSDHERRASLRHLESLCGTGM